MLMVIFGAGASYDSCPTYPPRADVLTSDGLARLNRFNRLPLANELFENRPLFADTIERFPDCQPIVPRLRSLTNETLEAALEDLQTQSEAYVRGRRQLAAVGCYLHQVIAGSENGWRGVAKGVTNYKRLLDQIERTHPKEQVCLVTFNYDTLLEDALRQFDLPITSIDDYTKKHPFYRVFKLHGSTNWAREVETTAHIEMGPNIDSIFAQLIEQLEEIRITDTYVFSPNDPAGLVRSKPTFPAIAIPVERKHEFECPQHMLDQLVELLPKITKILVIGWRATEAHFLDLLNKHLQWGRNPYVCIVSADQAEAEQTGARIRAAVPFSSFNAEPAAGFTAFMQSRRPEGILGR